MLSTEYYDCFARGGRRVSGTGQLYRSSFAGPRFGSVHIKHSYGIIVSSWNIPWTPSETDRVPLSSRLAGFR